MKCDKCKFLFNNGTYEYPEYMCKIFGDEIHEPFYKEGGCLLHFKEGKKMSNLYDQLDDLRFFRLEFTDGTLDEFGFPKLKKVEDFTIEEKEKWNYYINLRERLFNESNDYAAYLKNKYMLKEN